MESPNELPAITVLTARSRECLRLGIVPFIITEALKMYYYNGLRQWPKIKGYLMDTCLSAQDNFKLLLSKFRIPYTD